MIPRIGNGATDRGWPTGASATSPRCVTMAGPEDPAMPVQNRNRDLLSARDRFVDRHVGPREEDLAAMLGTLGLESLDDLLERAVPEPIRMEGALALEPPRTEREVLEELRALAERNRIHRSYIGQGYSECVTPAVIQRSLLENPGWYTAYTPYQPEISQGRLQALLNFQTMVADLTGLDVANASMLDEGTAAAEAMTMCRRMLPRGREAHRFLVSDRCHPQTIEVVRGRAEPLGIEVAVGDAAAFGLDASVFGVLVQYPTTDGTIVDWADLVRRAHDAGAFVVVATDLLALTLLRAPGTFGADVAVGSSQRFGVPLGYGGPHAGFLAVRRGFERQLPGRLVGVSKDADGNPAIRLALQTREQHIRRDKATSNICTAQVLLAVIASMYAVYHGPQGLRRIAERIRAQAATLAAALGTLGHRVLDGPLFDTLRVTPKSGTRDAILAEADARRVNLRLHDGGDLGISLGQTVETADLVDLVAIFGGALDAAALEDLAETIDLELPAPHAREVDYLVHPVFNRYHSETELLRYLHRLQTMDLALDTAMIPLGSCTMKLNAAAEMLPISYPGFAALHPFAPPAQAEGYRELIDRLGRWLVEITGFDGISFMPNAGAQGEYTGLLAIRAYHRARGDAHRDVCLIPQSAHGTNPASAALAGMRVVVVACDDRGNVDLDDLRAKAEAHREHLAALMVTYPSTHGVFEIGFRDLCAIVHDNGGQVYLDGANMNALVGISRPGELGADVCHLNLHKTFCIPHGGGGPGMGPICCAKHLTPFLPRHPFAETGGEHAIAAVSSAPYGSPGILPIPYAYIAMMGADGLKRATLASILAANYVAKRLEGHFDLLYSGKGGFVAHECILDPRPFKDSAGVTVDDIAKRLMDYGFHAPTMSFPVAGTLMVEPTESESKEELDRFCDAMIRIREEIRAIEEGRADREDNALKRAPHTAAAVTADAWDRAYSREQAAFPAPWSREHKFWPAVARIDNAYGDRNLMCSCPPIEEYA